MNFHIPDNYNYNPGDNPDYQPAIDKMMDFGDGFVGEFYFACLFGGGKCFKGYFSNSSSSSRKVVPLG